MQAFLLRVVDHIRLTYPGKIHQLCIILPNRRAGLYLKKYLSEAEQKVVWSPDVFAMEDFIAHLAEVEITDNISLLFELYQNYLSLSLPTPDSFDAFSKWGSIVLHDFNEIDRYLVDATLLFTNLKHVKEMESWSLSKDDLTPFQSQYLDFWKSLGTLYTSFSSALLSSHRAYDGLAYRLVAEQLQRQVPPLRWHKIIFAGFNALNRAEEKIIQTLIKNGNAEILWDTDAYYAASEWQEAGLFTRKNKRRFGSENFLWEEDLLRLEAKEIDIVGVPRNVGQAKVAGDIVHKWMEEQGGDLIHPEKTAIVLADEKLLFPVLHSLPEKIQDVNVTMGYPLQQTPLHTLVELVFSMQDNVNRWQKSKGKWYAKDIIRVLQHPLVQLLFQDAKAINSVIEQLIKRNIAFVSTDQLQEIIAELPSSKVQLLQMIFMRWKNAADGIEHLFKLFDKLKMVYHQSNEKEKSDLTLLELECLFAYVKLLKRLQGMMQTYAFVKEPYQLRILLQQLITSTTLPFSGEPLKGLQVMGMLETRTLDFEQVILLSVNENILPAGKSAHTFIPLDIKKAFHLPTYAEKDAVFAYHFYRLLQRAKRVKLLYNTETDTFGKGEKSRFITQLQQELPAVNKKVLIREHLLHIDGTASEAIPIILKKEGAALERLIQKTEQGLSPSALNTYINCTLQFYFRYLAKLTEQEELEETIQADVIGNVIHKVLQELYTPYLNKQLKTEDLENMMVLVDEKVHYFFRQEFSENDLSYGKNFLIIRLAKKMLFKLLAKERDSLRDFQKKNEILFLKAVEMPIATSVVVNSRTVVLSGKADRIDTIGSITRIVDYKTGSVTVNELNILELEEITSDTRFSKVFQLLMYAYLFYKQNHITSPFLRTGIVSLRRPAAGLLVAEVERKTELTNEVLDRFEKQLLELLSQLLDPSVPFSQTEDTNRCLYCEFRSVCSR